MRKLIDPANLKPFQYFQAIQCAMVPRPVAWVSTISENGIPNLAPYAMYSLVSANPPLVMISSLGEKDTLVNARATGEFVINVATEELLDQVNQTCDTYAPEISEFDACGLQTAPSHILRTPRVAASPVSMECSVTEIIPMGNGNMIFGRIIALSADQSVLADDGLISYQKLAPVSRLGRSEWGLPRDTKIRVRPDQK